MTAAASLEQLVARLGDGEILDDPTVADGIVRGGAHFEAAGVTVTVSIDPELDDVDAELDEADVALLIERVEQVLAMGEAEWRNVTDTVIAELEAEDDGAAETAADQVDLDNDLEARSLVVFADAVLVRFAAPRRFRGSRIVAQLNDAFEVEGVDVEDDDVV